MGFTPQNETSQKESSSSNHQFSVAFAVTLPEANIFAPENGWLEYFLVSFWGPVYVQVRKC